jgi:hypothetical protein
MTIGEFELGLGQENRIREVGAGQICPAEIGAHEIGPPQVRAGKVGM